ncbi:flagellar hook-associated protein FlgL [Desulfotruncus alcoholivorax]|uniref:flagellar hook-associated protein FlgL n=1 Tax=Desulfotruncus alcoholivorax TaxID=265477 RepID=UPI0003FFA967|nr:flagellar hook-associated protein FlgL [Desulfotruncus alcoholivorax]
MRVTNRIITYNTQNYIQQGLQKLTRTQEMMSTQRSIINLSDDPGAINQLLLVKSSLSMNEQYVRNIKDGMSYLEAADTAFGTAGSLLQKTLEYTLQAANGGMAPDDLKAIGRQIDQIIDEMKDIGNTTVGGKYIFAGTQNSRPPFERVDANTITFGGNFDAVSREILDHAYYEVNVDSVNHAGATINVVDADGDGKADAGGSLVFKVYDGASNVTDTKTVSYAAGESYDGIVSKINDLANYAAKFDKQNKTLTIQRAFFGADAKLKIENLDGGGNLIDGQSTSDVKPGLFSGIFDTLIKLKNDLLAGNAQNLNQYIGDLNNRHDEVLRYRVRVGARESHFESVQNQLLDQVQRLNQVESNLEDVDIAKVSIELSQHQMVYNASLAAGAQILQVSLLNYLR